MFVFFFYSILVIFFLIFLIPAFNKNTWVLKIFSFSSSIFIFVFSLFLWIFFNNLKFSEQLYTFVFWSSSLNIFYSLGLDGLSLFFVLLTTFLIPLCILSSWFHFNYCFKEFVVILFLVEFLLINFFLVTDLIFFYICFEGILLPLFIIIGSFGSRQRRIHASFQLFFLYFNRFFFYVI